MQFILHFAYGEGCYGLNPAAEDSKTAIQVPGVAISLHNYLYKNVKIDLSPYPV